MFHNPTSRIAKDVAAVNCSPPILKTRMFGRRDRYGSGKGCPAARGRARRAEPGAEVEGSGAGLGIPPTEAARRLARSSPRLIAHEGKPNTGNCCGARGGAATMRPLPPLAAQNVDPKSVRSFRIHLPLPRAMSERVFRRAHAKSTIFIIQDAA